MAHVVALPAEPRRRQNIQVAPCAASARGERRLGFNVATGLCDGLGAAAEVLCTDAGLRRLGATRRAVELRVCVLSTSLDREPDDLERHVDRVAALRATKPAAAMTALDSLIAEFRPVSAWLGSEAGALVIGAEQAALLSAAEHFARQGT